MASQTDEIRYQARVNMDDRLGELWLHITGMPRRTRVAQLVFLAQLGFVTMRTIGVQLAAAQPMPSTGVIGPAAVSPSEGSNGPEVTAPGCAGEQALSGWANVELDFPQ